jgi:hypothetical protein
MAIRKTENQYQGMNAHLHSAFHEYYDYTRNRKPHRGWLWQSDQQHAYLESDDCRDDSTA